MTLNPARQVFHLVLGLTYVGLGVFMYTRKVLPEPWGALLSLAFVLYGSWRIYRSIRIKQQDTI